MKIQHLLLALSIPAALAGPPGGDTGTTAAPDGTPVVGLACQECIQLCDQCNADGSQTADCTTVCEIVADIATCDAKCADTLNLGKGVGATEDETPVPSSTPVDPPTTAAPPPPPTEAAGGAFPPGAACSVCESSCASCGNSGTASCRTVCEIIQDPTTCDQRCTDTLHLGEWVGSANPQASTSACECLALCHQCETTGLENTPGCQKLCAVAADPDTCESSCASELNLGEWDPENSASAACVCTSLCAHCGSSNTADCATVCEIASDAATCNTKCAETLHLGEYYQASGTADPTSSGYSKASVLAAGVVVAAALVQL